MNHHENISSFNIKISENKENIPINIYKSNTPEKPKNNIILLNKNKFQPTSLDDKLSQNNNHLFINSNIKYGIDETGNPINIKEYYKSINDSVNLNSNTSIFSGLTNMTQKLKKPIAYITKDENNNNILIDLKGNKITTKNKDGDYDFPLQLHVVIKDFDVKHPELRVNGERFYKDNDILEDFNITEELEKDNSNENEKGNISKIYKTEENNIKYNNAKEYFEGFEEAYSKNNNNKNELGNLVFKSNLTKNNKDSLYYTKYNNINLIEANNNKNNKIFLRTSDILNSSNNSHSQSPDCLKNSTKANNFINLINNNYKEMTKNRSFIGNILRNNTSNFLSFRYKRDLSDNNKKDNLLNSRIKSFKSAININNINSNFKRKKFDKGNDIKFFHRNKNRSNIFNEKLYTDINISNQKLNHIYPYDKNDNLKILNKNINNYKYKVNTQFGNNNNKLYFNKSQNYFIIKHNKSFTNSNLLNKKDNDNEGKEKIFKRIKKKSILIPINGNKNKIKNNKYMYDFHIIKNKLNNSNINKIKKKNNKINSQDISQRIKKIEGNKKSKIFKIDNNNINKKYYILSKEANNIIKSYSKKKLKKDEKITKKIDIMGIDRKQKSPNVINKYNLLSNENKSYFNNLLISSKSNKKYYNYIYENKDYFSKNNLKKINSKYAGINLSLKNIENNKDRKNNNNQIILNFSPLDAKYESLIKNKNINYRENINNIIGKNRLNNLDIINKDNKKKFYFSEPYD